MWGSAQKPGGFGATTTGFGAASSGFGAQPQQPAAAATGWGAAKPATTGFGAQPQQPAAATGWGAQPATTGFGAQPQQPAATTGWGAQPATSGFGAQPQQTAATTGWGAQPAATGFGAQPGTSMGWGAQPQQQQQQQPQQPQVNYVALQDFARQSALASFLMELDKAYDALGPECRFRTFVYNACPPGQVTDAVQKQRYIVHLNGGSVPEKEWMTALQASPQPDSMYPQLLHFSQELQKRCDKQQAELKRLIERVDGYLDDVEAVVASDEANKRRLREMRQEDVMLRRRWYLLQQKLEVLSRMGHRSGDEGLLLRQVAQLRQTLAAPGRFRDALQTLQPMLDSEAEMCAENRSAADGKSSPAMVGPAESGLLRAQVDTVVMEHWAKFAEQMQNGIEALHRLLDTDLKDMAAIRERIAS